MNCYNLVSVTLPPSITIIDGSAFANCTSLSSFTLQSSTPPTLAANAFANIPATCVFTCPDASLEAYRNDPQWKDFFSIPYPFNFTFDAEGNVTVTGPVAPQAEVTQLVIPQEIFYRGAYYPVTAIGASAFAGCTALSSVTLESSTPPALGAGAFDAVPAACAFTCPAAALDVYRNNPQWNAFFPLPYPFTFTVDAGGNVTVTGPVAPKATVTQMDIPQTVFYRGADCTITAIADSAFAGCTALATVTLQSGTPPALGAGAFEAVPGDCAFSCPAAALDAYRNDPQWAPFFPQLPPDALRPVPSPAPRHVDIFDLSGKKLFTGDPALFHNPHPALPIIIRHPSGASTLQFTR
jgi:NAD-dependent dihydropyrimidine dehydrogenase PreA subunit